jgi:hypothetical protein
MEFLRNPMFWISVVIVALVVNWAMMKFFGQGKLV